jgi:membrane protease YdiL (CAAX protease family)
MGLKTASITAFIVTIAVPIIEEILFRGFIQDTIKTIQEKVLKVDENSTVQKVVRVFVQGILFGITHLNKLHTLAVNICIVAVTAFIGMVNGYLKEKQNSLFGAITVYSVHNSCIIVQLYFLA